MSSLEAEDAAIVGSPHRFEVITGDAPRRVHGDLLKGRLVALTLAPGSCIADIARAHGLHPQLLYRWRREAKEGRLMLPASDTPDFTPVVVDDMAAASRPDPLDGAPAASSPAAVLPCSAQVIVEVGDVTVRLPGDVDIDRLARIVAALRGVR